MAPPRAGMNELGGSATAVRPAVKVGTKKIIRETCWWRLVEMTEKVTVTKREKLKGVTETCTRHVETREIIKKTTEIKTPETREMETVEERLHNKDGVKDEHTHTEVVEDHEGELGECLVTWCEQLDSLLQERGEGVCPLEADRDQVGSVVPSELEGGECCGRVHAELWGYGGPGNPCGGTIPQCDCPGVCVHECGEMRAEKHA